MTGPTPLHVVDDAQDIEVHARNLINALQSGDSEASKRILNRIDYSVRSARGILALVDAHSQVPDVVRITMDENREENKDPVAGAITRGTQNHRWHMVQWINDVIFKGDELTKLQFWSGNILGRGGMRSSRFAIYMSGEHTTDDVVDSAKNFQSQGAV